MGLKEFSYLDFKVKFVDSQTLLDYAGMNSFAARAFGFRDLRDEYEILIDQELSEETQARTLKHEVIEFSLMKYDYLTYWQAHKIASNYERFGHNWVSLFYSNSKEKKDPLECFCVAKPHDNI
jgi:hypothetical protein